MTMTVRYTSTNTHTAYTQNTHTHTLPQLKQKLFAQARLDRLSTVESLPLKQQQKTAAAAKHKQPALSVAAGADSHTQIDAERRAKEFEAMLLAEEEAEMKKKQRAKDKV
jgi:hypothetical protein